MVNMALERWNHHECVFLDETDRTEVCEPGKIRGKKQILEHKKYAIC